MHFKGGPANGLRVVVDRYPYLVRAFKRGTQWGALDKLSSTPEPGDELFAYKKAIEYPTFSVYLFVEPQPALIEMVGTNSWRDWCMEYADGPEAA